MSRRIEIITNERFKIWQCWGIRVYHAFMNERRNDFDDPVWCEGFALNVYVLCMVLRCTSGRGWILAREVFADSGNSGFDLSGF